MKKKVFYLMVATALLITACENTLDKDLFKYMINAPVTDVELSQSTLTLAKNATATLTATITPSRAVNQDVTWSSSNSNIASVNDEGEVSGKSAGTATITVTTEDGGKTASCTVTVVAEGVATVTLDKTELELLVGEEETLEATIESEFADNQAVTWSSSDETIASVAKDGKVTGMGPGDAVITVTTAEGGFQATCAVTVIRPAEGVILSETDVVIPGGGSIILTATVEPEDASNQKVRWTTHDWQIISIAPDETTGGIIVTGLNEGLATVTAITDDGEFTAECVITVGGYELWLCGGVGSKIWTWNEDADPDCYGMGDAFDDTPEWWIPADGMEVDELEYIGASMTFSYDGLTLVKTLTDKSTEEGTFTLDLTVKHPKWARSMGKLITDGVTVLLGIDSFDEETPVYEYDVLKLTNDELVLGKLVPDGEEGSDPDGEDWGQATLWLFKAK